MIRKEEMIAKLAALPDGTELYLEHEEFAELYPASGVEVVEVIDQKDHRGRPRVQQILPGMGTTEPKRKIAVIG